MQGVLFSAESLASYVGLHMLGPSSVVERAYRLLPHPIGTGYSYSTRSGKRIGQLEVQFKVQNSS